MKTKLIYRRRVFQNFSGPGAGWSKEKERWVDSESEVDVMLCTPKWLLDCRERDVSDDRHLHLQNSARRIDTCANSLFHYSVPIRWKSLLESEKYSKAPRRIGRASIIHGEEFKWDLSLHYLAQRVSFSVIDT
jgi:hypothetical protein